MSLVTRLTTRLEIRHPIILAPMDLVSGGLLASTVSRAGGLGLVAGGYGDDYEWLEREVARTEGTRVGCGFISWSLARDAGALHKALDSLQPVAVLLSFGDPGPFALAVRESGAVLMIQVQTVELARRALDLGAEIVVAQGAEAGGHVADNRSTLALVPAVVDLVSNQAPDALVVAAGGIGDGRGLAAALALGADGVLMGTRFWASRQALVPAEAQARMVEASGDDTVRTGVADIARGHDWPRPFTGRVLRNQFTDRWAGAEGELRDSIASVRDSYQRALAERNFDIADVPGGEGVGLVRSIESADDIVRSTVAEAEATIAKLWTIRDQPAPAAGG